MECTDRPPYHFDSWADPEACGYFGWDHDTGAPTIGLFGAGIQVWSVMQIRRPSVAEAALAFNVSPDRIIEAVEAHDFMFLEGDRGDLVRLFIGHDRE